MKFISIIIRHQIIMVFVILVSADAFCTLGEKAQSVQGTNQKKLVQEPSYSVQETDLSGIKLREYVLPNGTVFAVTWRGIKHPDLSSILGSYNTEYEKLKNQREKPVGRAPIHVQSSKVSVKMSGHMRDVRGEAYDPNLLPAHFSIQDLK